MRTEAQIRAALARLPPHEAEIIAEERRRLREGEIARRKPFIKEANSA